MVSANMCVLALVDLPQALLITFKCLDVGHAELLHGLIRLDFLVVLDDQSFDVVAVLPDVGTMIGQRPVCLISQYMRIETERNVIAAVFQPVGRMGSIVLNVPVMQKRNAVQSIFILVLQIIGI